MITNDPATERPRSPNHPPIAMRGRGAGAPRLFKDERAAANLSNRFGLPDPLGEDDGADRAMAISMRRLGRVVMLSAEVGARFEREGIDHDAAAWMHAPRALFSGRAAIVACQDRAHFTRAMLLHGLGLGLDARADDIDALVDGAGVGTGRGEEGAPSDVPTGDGPAVPALFTAVLVDVSDAVSLFAFHAGVADSRLKFEHRLRERLGGELFLKASIRDGYDGSDPVVSASVSDAVDEMLEQVAADPASPLARGLDIVIEQRFAD